MSEDAQVRKINFPRIPDSTSEDMRRYLMDLQIVLEEALKGSLLLDSTFETGVLGN